MRNHLTNLSLVIIAMLLATIAVRTEAVQAQTDRRLHIEPGLTTIRYPDGYTEPGRLVIDLDTGDAWGFPNLMRGTLTNPIGATEKPPL